MGPPQVELPNGDRKYTIIYMIITYNPTHLGICNLSCNFKLPAEPFSVSASCIRKKKDASSLRQNDSFWLVAQQARTESSVLCFGAPGGIIKLNLVIYATSASYPV